MENKPEGDFVFLLPLLTESNSEPCEASYLDGGEVCLPLSEALRLMLELIRCTNSRLCGGDAREEAGDEAGGEGGASVASVASLSGIVSSNTGTSSVSSSPYSQ